MQIASVLCFDSSKQSNGRLVNVGQQHHRRSPPLYRAALYMWSIIALSGHLPLYAAGRLDCVDGAATQRVNGKRGLRVAHCMKPYIKNDGHVPEIHQS